MNKFVRLRCVSVFDLMICNVGLKTGNIEVTDGKWFFGMLVLRNKLEVPSKCD